MKGENQRLRGMLRGYMFEVVLLRFLAENGFHIIAEFEKNRTKKTRARFIELRGRGSWHQIDCPCDSTHTIPFIYPIRLLGEVKFHQQPIDKRHIREFIGVVKDIQENYFVAGNSRKPLQRVTEIGVYFSASGFDREAERLAFAHNIKTLSYDNLPVLVDIKHLIERLEANHLRASTCVAEGKLGRFLEDFERALEPDPLPTALFLRRVKAREEFIELIGQLRDLLRGVRASFIGNTSAGAFLHFIGEHPFPEELFERTDTGSCRVHYVMHEDGYAFHLTFTGDTKRPRRRFFFVPPLGLAEAAFLAPREVPGLKRQLFRTVSVSRHIDGLSRNLTLALDTDWLNAVEAEEQEDA